jgi:hypothetical protein
MWTRKEIEDKCHLGAPEPYQSQYIDTLFRYQATISIDKYDLGLAKDFTHQIHLKDDQPIFRKQFNLLVAHTQFIEQTLDETGSGSQVQFPVQLTNILHTQKARPRTQNCSRFPATQPALAH